MEDSLLEYTNDILNLLNKATHKDNLSSPHLVQRLEYLKHRLDDFLCQKMSGLSDVKSGKPGPMKQQTDDTGVLYECGVCKSQITMYKGDHKLSMALHCQEEVHQRALSKANNKPVPKVNDKHMSLVKGGSKYLCLVCNSTISNDVKCVEEHLQSNFHKSSLEAAENQLTPAEWKVHRKYFVKNEDGSLHCKLCPATVNDVSNELLNHVRSKNHTSKCVQSPKQEEPQAHPQKSNLEAAEDSWSKLPDEWKIHRKYFVKNENKTFHCNLCVASVSDVSNALLVHLQGKKHTSKSKCVPSLRQEDDVWLALPKELQPQKPLFQNCESGELHCKVCGSQVKFTSKTLLDHVRGSTHVKRIDAFMVVNGVANGTRCTWCNVVTTSKSNMIEHVVSMGHQQKFRTMFGR